jgi:predicted aconitase
MLEDLDGIETAVNSLRIIEKTVGTSNLTFNLNLDQLKDLDKLIQVPLDTNALSVDLSNHNFLSPEEFYLKSEQIKAEANEKFKDSELIENFDLMNISNSGINSPLEDNEVEFFNQVNDIVHSG